MDQFFAEFGVDVLKLAFQIVNFLIVLYLLNRFLFKPVLARLDERKSKIEKGLEDAEHHEGLDVPPERATAGSAPEAA